jgi:hypothetical protein
MLRFLILAAILQSVMANRNTIPTEPITAEPCLPSATNLECIPNSDLQRMMQDDPDQPEQKAAPKPRRENKI